MSPRSHVQPHSALFLRQPSGSVRCIENIKPNTIIEVGKIGSFPSNLLLGRPYYHSYELLEKRGDEAYSRLRIVPPSELNAEVVAEDVKASESRGEAATPSSSNGVLETSNLVGEDAAVIEKNNRLTVDDASRQALSHAEIEELKKSADGREIIARLMANHTALDEKTAFSRAKYTLRKAKKYLKRFTVLPMNLGYLIDWVTEKEPSRILEMREETLGLMTAWSNAHFNDVSLPERLADGRKVGGGRYLVVDEAGGLVVAALAERMGLLYADHHNKDEGVANPEASRAGGTGDVEGDAAVSAQFDKTIKPGGPPNGATTHPKIHHDFPVPAPTNTITLLHPAVQPNLSLLKYFGYDTNQPDPTHPLHTHMTPLSWLQLLHPSEDPTYREPERVSETELEKWKSGRRGTYWKKRRRWERCSSIVDATREGGFDSLIIASNMDPSSILAHTVPLVRGSGHIVIYSPTAEPLVKLMDLYSKDRKAAYNNALSRGAVPDPEDFPVDPRLLLAPTLQTSRVREWQVLPGRTHPLMTSKGGAEGYVFTARRVIPLKGGVEARGNFATKRRRVDGGGDVGAGEGAGKR